MSTGFGNRGGFEGCRIEREERRAIAAPAFSSVSPTRHLAIRILWGALATVTGLAAVGLTLGGTFAPPEMERVQLGTDRSYYINAFRLMYFFASALAPLSLFAVWKASHRGGIGFWRSTARPGLMAVCATVLGAGLTFSSFIAAGGLQIVGLVASAAAAAVFFILWMLRGPSFDLLPTDAYWNRAFAVLFAIAALFGSVATVHSWHHWSHDGRNFALNVVPFRNVEVVEREWDRYQDRYVDSPVTYRVPRMVYDRTPVAAWLLGLATLGCFAEMRYRLKVAGRAAQLIG